MSRCPWCGGDSAAELRSAVTAALRDVLPELLDQRLREVLDERVGEQRRPSEGADVVSFTRARRLVSTSYAAIARAIRFGDVPAEYDLARRRWRIDRAALEAWSRNRWSRAPR